MQTFVTGSTGLLGNNLVRALLAAGHRVRALVRSREKATRLLGGLDVELVEGEMTDVAAFAPALAGVEVLFHTAAYFREYYGPGDHWSTMESVNVHGTRALLEAAHAHGVRRVVDTSSSGIIGLRPDGSPGDEETPPAPIARANLYFRSKLLAEEAARDVARRTGLSVAWVFPGWMFGPGDAGPTAAGQLVRDFLDRALPAIPPGGTCVVDARDVAAGMISLARPGAPEGRFVLGGRFTALPELVSTLERVSGVRGPRVRVPYPVALAVAVGAQTWARLTGGTTVMSVEGLRTLGARLAVSSAKAERLLGIRFRPLEDTLRDCVAWARAQPPAPAEHAPRRPLRAAGARAQPN